MVEIFLGVLLGLLVGMFLCAKYLRQEITANIGPRLTHIERQLETLQSEVNLDAATRMAALTERFETHRPPPYPALGPAQPENREPGLDGR